MISAMPSAERSSETLTFRTGVMFKETRRSNLSIRDWSLEAVIRLADGVGQRRLHGIHAFDVHPQNTVFILQVPKPPNPEKMV